MKARNMPIRRRQKVPRNFQVIEIKNAARYQWPNVLANLGVELDERALRGIASRCPGCGGKDRFRFDDKGGNGTFYCSGGGQGDTYGDGLQLLNHVRGWSFPETLERIAEILHSLPVGSEETTGPKAAADPAAVVVDREVTEEDGSVSACRMTETILEGCSDIGCDGQVAAYFCNRGLAAILDDLPEDLFEHSSLIYRDELDSSEQFYPGMCALIRDPHGKLVTLHRTFLQNGQHARVQFPRKVCPVGHGRLRGAVVRQVTHRWQRTAS